MIGCKGHEQSQGNVGCPHGAKSQRKGARHGKSDLAAPDTGCRFCFLLPSEMHSESRDLTGEPRTVAHLSHSLHAEEHKTAQAKEKFKDPGFLLANSSELCRFNPQFLFVSCPLTRLDDEVSVEAFSSDCAHWIVRT